MKMKRPILLLFAALFCLSASALDVVKDGKPCAEIVLDARTPQGVKLAAQDLQHFLEKISGAKLEIVPAPTGKFRNRLFVGENEFTKKLGYRLPAFKSSGYDILVKDDYAVLSGPSTIYPPLKYTPKNLQEYWKYVGGKYGLHCFDHGGGKFRKSVGIFANDDIGPFHAVSALLESLGVRFYAPYEDGTVIPESKNISLKNGRITREAAYDHRDWYHPGDEAEGHLWLKRLKNGVASPIVLNHTTRNLISNPVNRKLHPNWYTEEAPGKFYAGAMNQGGIPRFTDPDFQNAMIAWVEKLLDTYPMLCAVTCGAPDGGHVWDWRDREKYLKPGVSAAQAYANLMWDFHVAIADRLRKTHPDKKLFWWCQYNDTVPDNIDPNHIPDNLIFRPGGVAPETLVMKHVFDSRLQVPQRYARTFGKRAKGVGWEYWLPYRYPYMPRYPIFYPHVLQKYRQAMLPYSNGMFAEISASYKSEGNRDRKTQWRLGEAKLMAPMVYINCKLLWDPNLDMKALLDEYYRLYFGPAEKEMLAFFEYAEKIWCRNESRTVTETSGFLKEKEIPEFFRLLAAAKAKTETGSVYRRRIEYLEKGYAPLKKLFSSLKRSGPLFRINSYKAKTEPDCDLSTYRWWQPMPDNQTAAPIRKNRTEASFTLSEDRKFLQIAVRCYESRMDKLAAACRKNDDKGIFSDDLVEIYIDTPERNYFKVCVNPNGVIWDECTDVTIITRDTLPILWNPGTRAAVRKYADRWEVEVVIPTADFGKLGPTRQYPWGLNICRTRVVDRGVKNAQSFAIAPTGGPYRTQKYWARIWKR